MSEVMKTRKIINSVRLALTEDEVVAYIVDGVKRYHKELKDYDLKVFFDTGALQISATVEGERVS